MRETDERTRVHKRYFFARLEVLEVSAQGLGVTPDDRDALVRDDSQCFGFLDAFPRNYLLSLRRIHHYRVQPQSPESGPCKSKCSSNRAARRLMAYVSWLCGARSSRRAD